VKLFDRFKPKSSVPKGPAEAKVEATTAADTAASLFHWFVEEESEGTNPERYHVPLGSASRFRARMRRYREAALLLTLIQAQKGKLHVQVLRQYERLFLPSSPTSEGLQYMEELKAATEDIERLIDPAGERKPLSWAVEWFKQIGYDDDLNPVDLQLFSLWWMDHCILAADAVTGCCPIDFTEEETKAINRTLKRLADWAEANAPKGTHAVVAQRLKDGMIAMALIEYVGEVCVQQKACAKDGEWIALMDKAITAQRKAYAIHGLPVYLFEIARLFDFVGDSYNARRFFAAFIKAQGRFKPDQVDTLLLRSLGCSSQVYLDVSDEAVTTKMVAFAREKCRKGD
jgi:hypothetical protein